uniref:C-type lectin domain-containing protein n=1 Tax=Oreochromis niloticus TaxID=8128 RepID=A0A669DAK4_ORENI
MAELLTLSLRERPATLRRKLISAACIRDLVYIYIYIYIYLSETQLRDKDEGSLHMGCIGPPLFIPVTSLTLMTEHFLSHLNHTNMHIAFFHLNEILCWEHHGGKCYYFSVSKSSWTESRGECRAKGGDLVKIDSREEQKFLDQRLKDIMNYPQDKFWFGLTDSAEEGRWLWVDGSLLDKRFDYWEYFCETSDLNSWFDASCNVAHRSICEKPEITGQPTKASQYLAVHLK